MPKNPWGWVAVSFMVSMFVILWPKGETRKAMRERIVYVLPQDEIPEEAARLRGQAVFEEAKRLSGTDNYPAERYIVDMIELSRLRVYSRYMGRFNNNAIFSMTRNHVANLFLSQKEEVRSRLRTPALQERIENEWSRYDRFVPEETRWHFIVEALHFFLSSYSFACSALPRFNSRVSAQSDTVGTLGTGQIIARQYILASTALV